MEERFEVYQGDDIREFETFEDAEEFANAHDADTIYQTGGAWDEFKKCAFCGEWYPETEMEESGICWRCDVAIRSRGERW